MSAWRALALLLVAGTSGADGMEMAVTFDDLPFNRHPRGTLEQDRTDTLQLLHAVVSRGIPAIGFVNEGPLADGDDAHARADVLRLWLAAGLDLGNHGQHHLDLHRVPADEFIDDIERGELLTRRLLQERGMPLAWFRHPFLHTGMDAETRDAVHAALAARGYRVAPVTIDNSEWIFARAYDVAFNAGDDSARQRIGEAYLDYMLDMVAYYEDQSRQLFGRNIRHVLLLHANRLNAHWFAPLADRIAGRGYRFITLEHALADPAYTSDDRYFGPGGITWLHRWALTQGRDPAMFRGEPESPDWVQALAGIAE